MSGQRPLLIGHPPELEALTCPVTNDLCDYVEDAAKKMDIEKYPFNAELAVMNCVINETGICAFAAKAVSCLAERSST